MLKFVIFFTFTLVLSCSGNRKIGDFNQIVLTQSHPITAFWMAHNYWPVVDQRPERLGLTNGAWESLTTPSQWVIENFWPWKAEGSNPEFCYTAESDKNNVRFNTPLKYTLAKQWPYYKQKGEEIEWNLHWHRHGLCMRNLPQISSPVQYFNKAVKLIYDNNFGTLLGLYKLDPGTNHKLSDINKKLENFLKFNPMMQCVIDENSPNKEQYLYQVSACFNTNFEVEKCRMPLASTCDNKKNVFIPALKN